MNALACLLVRVGRLFIYMVRKVIEKCALTAIALSAILREIDNEAGQSVSVRGG